jgi:hypothetical protein
MGLFPYTRRCGCVKTGAVKPLLVVVTVAAALVVPTAAMAAPPTLVSVGHTKQHPTVRWTLPLGVESQAVEIATDPAQATDGSFFPENLVLFELVEASQTSYTSRNRRLKTGVTYYVHTSGIDWPCFFVFACPVREWSNVLTLTIPNAAPVLQSRRWNAHRTLRSGNATLQVCDDEGDFQVFIGQQRLRRGKVAARGSSVVSANLLVNGCGSLRVTWSIPAKLIAIGDFYRVTFTVVDAGGRRSRTISGQSLWDR